MYNIIYYVSNIIYMSEDRLPIATLAVVVCDFGAVEKKFENRLGGPGLGEKQGFSLVPSSQRRRRLSPEGAVSSTLCFDLGMLPGTGLSESPR
jgi:hypothetical protein